MRYGTLVLLLVSASCIFIPVSQVYAWNGNDGVTNLGFEIKKGWQWFTETITTDPIQKQSILVKNMASWQQEKEELIAKNKPIPQEIDQLISEKKMGIENIHTESTNALSQIIDTITVGKELGKIQDYISIFHKLKTNQITGDERVSTITQLEYDANNLELAKKHCTHVSVNDVLNAEDSYEKIKSYCSILNTIPKQVVMNTVGEI